MALMLDDEDSNIFEGIPVEAVSPVPEGECSISVLSEEQLGGLSRENLIRHVLHIQDMHRQLKEDNTVLDWELHECRESLTYFSRAAKLAHRLNASDLETIASVAINDISEYFDCKFGALFLYDGVSGTFELYRSSSPAPDSTRPVHVERDAGHFLIKLFLGHDEPCIVEYAGAGEINTLFTDERIMADVPADWHKLLGRRAMIFPLRINYAERGERIFLGGLLVGDADKELLPKDAEVATIFSDLLSSSLYNARLVQRLNEMTTVDPLTQIYNRRHLINQLNSAMLGSRRYGYSLSIAMIDIDFFKCLNDACGHLCGDEVLKKVACILQESIRKEVDIAARYGGEEFMLLMPYTGVDHALEVADRVRRKIRECRLFCDGRDVSITCSIGVAEYVDGEGLETFIDRADVALYEAKNNGRDKVCSAEQCKP